MSDIPQGYRDISEEDRKKAEAFFARGVAVAGTGNFEYAIEMYLQGLNIDPESIEAHQALRDISLRRKASGGKKMGFMEAMKLNRAAKDEKANMLAAEKLLAYDPGNTDHMVSMIQNAYKAGAYDTVLWIGPILLRANADSPKPEFNKYIILKDHYRQLQHFKQAAEALQHALQLKPDDMDLQREVKDLSARETIQKGNYEGAGSFRKSMRDANKQEELLRQDQDIRDVGMMAQALKNAEAEWQADPDEAGKLSKFVDVLVKTEQPEYEARAIELLEAQYEKTRQYRFRARIGLIREGQMSRTERAMRQQLKENPTDENVKAEYRDFLKDRAQQLLEIYSEASENYPTDMSFKYKMAMQLLALGRNQDAIPVFQQVRNDPKFRIDATTLLGRAFLDAGFIDEAVDTLKSAMDEYQLKGDAKSIDMTYWYARALEEKKDVPSALKAYSQVAQWNFNFKDTQQRIKRLRASVTA